MKVNAIPSLSIRQKDNDNKNASNPLYDSGLNADIISFQGKKNKGKILATRFGAIMLAISTFLSSCGIKSTNTQTQDAQDADAVYEDTNEAIEIPQIIIPSDDDNSIQAISFDDYVIESLFDDNGENYSSMTVIASKNYYTTKETPTQTTGAIDTNSDTQMDDLISTYYDNDLSDEEKNSAIWSIVDNNRWMMDDINRTYELFQISLDFADAIGEDIVEEDMELHEIIDVISQAVYQNPEIDIEEYLKDITALDDTQKTVIADTFNNVVGIKLENDLYDQFADDIRTDKIPLNIILSTDFSLNSEEETQNVFMPVLSTLNKDDEINGNDADTLTRNIIFNPQNSNLQISVDLEDESMLNSNGEVDRNKVQQEVLNQIALNYGLSETIWNEETQEFETTALTLNSLEGINILSALGKEESNNEIFDKMNENTDTIIGRIVSNVIDNGGELELTCPNTAISLLASGQFITDEKGAIEYLTMDLSELNKQYGTNYTNNITYLHIDTDSVFLDFESEELQKDGYSALELLSHVGYTTDEENNSISLMEAIIDARNNTTAMELKALNALVDYCYYLNYDNKYEVYASIIGDEIQNEILSNDFEQDFINSLDEDAKISYVASYLKTLTNDERMKFVENSLDSDKLSNALNSYASTYCLNRDYDTSDETALIQLLIDRNFITIAHWVSTARQNEATLESLGASAIQQIAENNPALKEYLYNEDNWKTEETESKTLNDMMLAIDLASVMQEYNKTNDSGNIENKIVLEDVQYILNSKQIKTSTPPSTTIKDEPKPEEPEEPDEPDIPEEPDEPEPEVPDEPEPEEPDEPEEPEPDEPDDSSNDDEDNSNDPTPTPTEPDDGGDDDHHHNPTPTPTEPEDCGDYVEGDPTTSEEPDDATDGGADFDDDTDDDGSGDDDNTGDDSGDDDGDDDGDSTGSNDNDGDATDGGADFDDDTDDDGSGDDDNTGDDDSCDDNNDDTNTDDNDGDATDGGADFDDDTDDDGSGDDDNTGDDSGDDDGDDDGDSTGSGDNDGDSTTSNDNDGDSTDGGADFDDDTDDDGSGDDDNTGDDSGDNDGDENKTDNTASNDNDGNAADGGAGFDDDDVDNTESNDDSGNDSDTESNDNDTDDTDNSENNGDSSDNGADFDDSDINNATSNDDSGSDNGDDCGETEAESNNTNIDADEPSVNVASLASAIDDYFFDYTV